MRESMTQERLRELIFYDPDTGIITWNKGRQGVRNDGIAGSHHPDGYIKICIDKKIYLSHRLAFLYMEGYMPENQVDHINRIKDDNRWQNLREVSRSCNARNTGICSNNTSGVTGVYWYKALNNWHAQITVPGSKKHLGYFESFDDAVAVRWEAEVEYGYPNCNTTSSAYEYLKEHNLITDEKESNNTIK